MAHSLRDIVNGPIEVSNPMLALEDNGQVQIKGEIRFEHQRNGRVYLSVEGIATGTKPPEILCDAIRSKTTRPGSQGAKA